MQDFLLIRFPPEQSSPGRGDLAGKVKKRFKTKLKNQAVGVNERKSEEKKIDSELNLSNICSEKSSKQCPLVHIPSLSSASGFTTLQRYNVE